MELWPCAGRALELACAGRSLASRSGAAAGRLLGTGSASGRMLSSDELSESHTTGAFACGMRRTLPAAGATEGPACTRSVLSASSLSEPRKRPRLRGAACSTLASESPSRSIAAKSPVLFSAPVRAGKT
eukprot:3397168-Rhodomonas_salina.1